MGDSALGEIATCKNKSCSIRFAQRRFEPFSKIVMVERRLKSSHGYFTPGFPLLVRKIPRSACSGAYLQNRPDDQFNQKLLAADTLAEIVLKRPDVIDGSPAVFQTWATSTLRARSSCIFVVAYRIE